MAPHLLRLQKLPSAADPARPQGDHAAFIPASDRRSSLHSNTSRSSMPVDVTDAQQLASYLRSKIRTYALYPQLELPDVSSLLMDPQAFQVAIDALKARYAGQQITHIVSCEARGFLFGAPLALALQVPFVPVRRARHLPGKTVGVDFTSGFHTGRLEIHEDAMTKGARVVVIDDLVVTGNTLNVTCELVEKLGGEVVECGCVVRSVRYQELMPKIPVYGLLTM